MATDEDGTTPIDVLLFLPAALEQFREGRNTPDASGILAALCTAVGHMRHELVSRPRTPIGAGGVCAACLAMIA